MTFYPTLVFSTDILISSDLILFYLISSYLTLSYFILSCFILSYLIISYLILSCSTLFYLILSCYTLSCINLFYLIILYRFLCHPNSSNPILSNPILSHLFSNVNSKNGTGNMSMLNSTRRDLGSMRHLSPTPGTYRTYGHMSTHVYSQFFIIIFNFIFSHFFTFSLSVFFTIPFSLFLFFVFSSLLSLLILSIRFFFLSFRAVFANVSLAVRRVARSRRYQVNKINEIQRICRSKLELNYTEI